MDFEMWYNLLIGGFYGNYTGDVGRLKASNDGINYHIPNGYNLSAGQYNRTWDTVYNLVPGLFHYYVKDTVTGLIATYDEAVGASCDVYIDYLYVLASCGASDGAFTVKARYGQAPYTYSMDGLHFQSDSTFTGLVSGNYAVSVKDAGGNITSSRATVYNKCPKVLADSTPSNCGGNNGVIHVHGFLGTKPYQFSLNGGGYQSDSLFTNLAPDVYTVHIMDAKGFTDSITGISIGSICLNVSAQVINATCNQKNGAINAKGSSGTLPYLFSIDGVNFQNNNVFSNLNSGNYVLTIKDATNFTDTVYVAVLNIPPPILNLGNDTTLCSNQTLLLNPNLAGASYRWQDNSTNSTYNVTNAGKYWAQANVNGCTVSDTINISYLNLSNKIFPTNDTTLCVGTSILLDAKNPRAKYLWANNATSQTQTETTSGKYWVQLNVSGCSASDTINLHFITGPNVRLPKDSSFCSGSQIALNALSDATSFQWNNHSNNSSITVNQGGVYFVAASKNGCTTYDTVIVKQFPASFVFIGNDTTLCTGQTVVLGAGNGFTNYLWSNGSAASNISVAAAGKYYVAVTDNHNCTVADTINISYTLTPVFSLGNDSTLCEKQSLLLQSNAIGNYLWQDGTTQKQKTISSAGLYWLQINNNNCIYSDSILISYKPLPILHLLADTILCNQNTLLLNVAQTGNAAAYQWQDGSTVPSYLVTNAGTFMVKVTQNGCVNYDSCIVQYQQTPQVNSIKDSTKCKNESLLLDVSFPNANYLWQDFSSLPTYTVNSQGIYYCNITNYCGTVTDTFHVTDKICECTLIIPNVFSPNGDGINDIFKPNIDCVPSYYHMTIFDRNGHLIFTSNNISDYWNGTYQNTPVPIGTYYYILKVKGVSDPVIKEKSGSITLLR
jgi:gliding motility-associated-like protein